MRYFVRAFRSIEDALRALQNCHGAIIVEALWRDVESLHEEFGYGRHVEELGNGCERKEEARA